MRTGLGVIFFTIVAIGLVATMSRFVDVKSEVVLACITALITVSGWLYTSISTSKEAAQARLHTAKAVVYERLFDLITALMRKAAFEDKPPTEDEQNQLARELHEIKSKLLIWGSDSTLSHWLEIEDHSADVNKMILAWGKLFASMRRDLGHHDNSVAPSDLAVFFVKAADKNKFK